MLTDWQPMKVEGTCRIRLAGSRGQAPEPAMFCSECGKPVQGKYCSHCGTAVAGEHAEIVLAEIVPDWEHEVRYENILQYPGVRITIDHHARLAPKRLTGEQFLALADKLVPLGVSMEGLAGVAQALGTRLGMKTDKQRTQHVSAPVGEVIVRALCSLAKRGQTLRRVTQAADGCLLDATLPSDLYSLAGDLLVTVRRCGGGAEVKASTCIGGQWFDWGKSNRSLDVLFQDLATGTQLLSDAA